MNDPGASETVRRLAREEGFHRARIAPADLLPQQQRDAFARWVAQGRHAGLKYLQRNEQVRDDPRRLLEDARCVICLATSYAHDVADGPGIARVARYARARDYHKLLKKRCHRLMDRLGEEFPQFRGRAFVDAGPIMERSLAVLSGLGTAGCNGLLQVPGLGSYVLLSEIVCNLDLPPDEPLEAGRETPVVSAPPPIGTCLRCGACVAACPTAAIGPDGLIDVGRCVSYLTKETDHLPPERWEEIGTWIFGCDLCQEACPANRSVPAGDTEWSGPARRLPELTLAEVLGWTREDFQRIMAGTPVRKAGYERVLRNAILAAGNSGIPDLAPLVEQAARREPSLKPYADWALKRLAGEPNR
ncbi:MAG: tRNA epoxyqueuosine(34) reductase QueG [Phycisphaerae bacterium]